MRIVIRYKNGDIATSDVKLDRIQMDPMTIERLGEVVAEIEIGEPKKRKENAHA